MSYPSRNIFPNIITSTQVKNEEQEVRKHTSHVKTSVTTKVFEQTEFFKMQHGNITYSHEVKVCSFSVRNHTLSLHIAINNISTSSSSQQPFDEEISDIMNHLNMLLLQMNL